ASTYTSALYAEDGQNSSYSRLTSEPAGANTIVMFKSCFPNSNVEGSPSETATPIESNPLKGESGPLTVGNAKGVYRDLLAYFATQPDKMFVLIVSPPLRQADTTSQNAANARALSNWLVSPDGWLQGYSTGNVVAWDYFTVLTGGHHRVRNGVVEHFGSTSNYLKYPTGDSHPSTTGDRLATAEFVPFLNAAYRSWEASTGANLPYTSQRTCSLSSPSVGSRTISPWTHTWRGSISPAQIGGSSVRLEIQHLYGSGWRLQTTRTISLHNGSTSWASRFRLSHRGRYRLRTRHSDADHRLAYSSYRYVTVR
ncbi:MAG: hypothetical protein HY876_05525, partial [Coriobacteriales bacterium]|nr:hypothetical protein [Coriobacteriales bacterium]